MNPANTYHHGKSRREFCKACHAERQSDYRRRSLSVAM
jgi:hypothetical protein